MATSHRFRRSLLHCKPGTQNCRPGKKGSAWSRQCKRRHHPGRRCREDKFLPCRSWTLPGSGSRACKGHCRMHSTARRRPIARRYRGHCRRHSTAQPCPTVRRCKGHCRFHPTARAHPNARGCRGRCKQVSTALARQIVRRCRGRCRRHSTAQPCPTARRCKERCTPSTGTRWH
jgi:hypothetical protein